MPTDTYEIVTQPAQQAKKFDVALHHRFCEARLRNGDAWSLARLSRVLDSSSSAISKYLNGKPEGDVAKLEKYIGALLVNDELRQGAPPLDGELFETPVSRQLLNLCNLARKHRMIRAMIGEPGMGKSCARRLYLDSDPTAVAMELNRVKGGGTVAAIERHFRMHCTSGDWDKRAETPGEYILRSFKALERLVILDNAHLLSRQGLEWVLGFHDETRCPVVLVGNSELNYTLQLVQRAPSRVGAPVEAKLSTSGGCALKSPRDVAREFLRLNWAVAVDDVLDAATEVVSSFGSIRSLRHCVSIAKEWHGGKGCETHEKAFAAAREKQIPKSRLVGPQHGISTTLRNALLATAR